MAVLEVLEDERRVVEREVTVDEEVWTEAVDFLSTGSGAKVWVRREQPDGTQRIVFGDGTRGKVVDLGVAVVATYRIGGDQPGNVGAGAILRDRSGNGKLRNVRNPRDAYGWIEQEAVSADGLELSREAIPATLRTGQRAVTPDDTAALAVAFRTAAGSAAVSRALVVEEGFGLKTVAVVCVGAGGGVPSVADLEELAAYLNGAIVGVQRVDGVVLSNNEATPVAYTPLPIAVTVEIEVLAAYASGAEARVEAALESLLQPTARRLVLVDGVWEESTEYQWNLQSVVSRAVLIARIVTSQSGVTNVTLTLPAGDVALADYELPTPGTITVSVVVV